MRLPLGLLVGSVAAGVLSVAAALLAMRAASLQFGVVMLLSLLGHVLASRGARRVRWAVATGVGLLAVVTATRLLWYREQADEAGWPTSGAGLAKVALAAHGRELIDRERLASAGVALGVLCLAVGVTALPARGRRRGTVTAVLALPLLAWLGLTSARNLDGRPLPDLLGAVWPALLAALVAIGALALSGPRADRRWLLPAGLVLLSFAAVRGYADLASSWAGWWLFAHPAEATFLEVGLTVSTSTTGVTRASEAVETAIALAGTALVAVGALRGSRDADGS
ncbi:aminopeptidase [Micromonospora robiginosa]|uniref:Aminopeptidase n=1 Tax=Micromonospora robiginosa TaxID=2749844 RepID=A0A7L6B5R4_9ACTN|nr:aminopeptidase [Micromonospora ferruginea]QLQ37303.1 aminopeptidase [Micromonospora ferruginea]